ncbi:MAG TPA: hypothetical protein VE569_03000, partial [Acidimicrobiia bacterium]|nr:hypothetical protein [Acidimicrobiia bacterium]
GVNIARSQGGTPGSTGDWPIRITYGVDQFGGTNNTHFELVLEAMDWTAWREERTCCGFETGMITELHPDGSYWSGGIPGLPLTEVFVHEGGDGMVPLPDFAPRFPSTFSDLEVNPNINVLIDLQEGVGADNLRAELLDETDRLGLNAVDVVVYKIEREVQADGLTQNAVDTRWVYKPLNLTLRNTEVVAGSTWRVFQVQTIEFLPSDFAPSFGETGT